MGYTTDIQTLQRETSTWAQNVNLSQREINWQLKIAETRAKLRSTYPNSLPWQCTSLRQINS
ncbi:hypothetical protein [Tunicatimonas pelagia]|uniref:hypothetical protein n=1 Tax=Tunicatimonas pelagia TaxID=931531 RepID=UPI0026652211|nr:hypothetical protein [Tunicatimonas pelagia]WKN45355.1 hypothetical protein P0M28_10325 [Tunicatimonas pelagia]